MTLSITPNTITTVPSIAIPYNVMIEVFGAKADIYGSAKDTAPASKDEMSVLSGGVSFIGIEGVFPIPNYLYFDVASEDVSKIEIRLQGVS